MQLKGAFYYVIELRQYFKSIYFQDWRTIGNTWWHYLWSKRHWDVVVMLCLVMWSPSSLSWGIDQGGIQDWGSAEVWWHSLVTRLPWLVPAAAGALVPLARPPYWLDTGVTSHRALVSTYQHLTDQGGITQNSRGLCIFVYFTVSDRGYRKQYVMALTMPAKNISLSWLTKIRDTISVG